MRIGKTAHTCYFGTATDGKCFSRHRRSAGGKGQPNGRVQNGRWSGELQGAGRPERKRRRSQRDAGGTSPEISDSDEENDSGTISLSRVHQLVARVFSTHTGKNSRKQRQAEAWRPPGVPMRGSASCWRAAGCGRGRPGGANRRRCGCGTAWQRTRLSWHPSPAELPTSAALPATLRHGALLMKFGDRSRIMISA